MSATVTRKNAVKLAAHPTRSRILTELLKTNGKGTSPSELSQRLDQPLGNVSYHVRQLVDMGMLRQVRTKPVRGTLEHFYVLKPAAASALAEHYEKLAAQLREFAK